MIDPEKIEEARSMADGSMLEASKLQLIANLLNPHRELDEDDRDILSILVTEMADSIHESMKDICRILFEEMRKED